MRLFTALWPPAEAVAALAAEAALAGTPTGWRAVDPRTWHITLAFHGEADPGVLARQLERSARGVAAPRLRLAGAGEFPGVRWSGVEVGPDTSFDGLVGAAGGHVERFVPHVTVLRLRARSGPAADPDPDVAWSAHRGPWWTPQELLLVASERGREGPRYRVVHRVALPARAQ